MGRTLTFAAIDLGSNTCRLSVKSLEGGVWKTHHRYSSATRLGTELGTSNVFDSNAIERTLKAIGECQKRYQAYAPDYVRAVATEACRVAINSKELQARVYEEYGLTLEIISAEEEAYLCLCGCLEFVSKRKRYTLVFDIGGGSTELLLVENDAKHKNMFIRQIISLPFGVVRLTDSYDKHIHRVLPDIRNYVKENIQRCFGSAFLKSMSRNHKLQIIGCSGTATTAASLVLGLEHYDRDRVNGVRLRRAQLMNLSGYLGDNPPHKRDSYVGNYQMNLVPPGLAILLGICDACPTPSLQVADQGVRDGVIIDSAVKAGHIALDFTIVRPEIANTQSATEPLKIAS